MAERETVARWESDGGKYWAELYRDEMGFGHDARGSGGFMGTHANMTEGQAMAWMESRTAGGAGFFHPGKRPMRRTV